MVEIIKVGNWLIFPDNNKLCLQGEEYFIEPLAMEVLVFFSNHPQQVISRNQLIEAVWNGRVVGDHAVYRIINKLRQTLARDQSHEYIRTVRKKGYQLISEVSRSEPHEKSDESVALGSQHQSTESAGKNQSDWKGVKEDSPELSFKNKHGITTGQWRKRMKLAVSILAVIAVGYFIAKLYSYHSIPSYYQSTALITLKGAIRDPSFSPDGKMIAFSYQESTGADWDIFVESLIDGRLYQITDDASDELKPTWAPDGSRVAILRYDNEKCLIDAIAVPLSVSSTPLAASTLVGCSGVLQHNDIAWGKEGKYLYYTSTKSKISPLQVFRLTIDTGKTEQLTNYTQGETRGALAIKLSPDNQKLGILKDVNWRNSQIEVLDLASKQFNTVRSLVGWNRYFDWSKDGRTLIYNRNAKEIDAFDVSMRVEKNIAKSVEPISFPSHSPVKHELAVVAGRKVVNIVSEPLESTSQPDDSPVTVISSSSIDNYAEYANTTDQIAFVSRRTGEPQIWLKDTDGSEQQLTYFEQNFDIRRIRWSPQDDSLLFIHNQYLYQLELTDRMLKVLYRAKKGESIEGESWTQDGDSVLFSSNRDGDWQIYRINLSGKAENQKVEQLTLKGGYAAFESSERDGIYYLKYHTKGLWYKRYESEEETILINNVDVFSWNSIYLRHNNIYYLSSDYPKMKLYRFDLDEQQSYYIKPYYGSPWLFSISYRGDKVLYQLDTQIQSSLLLLKP